MGYHYPLLLVNFRLSQPVFLDPHLRLPYRRDQDQMGDTCPFRSGRSGPLVGQRSGASGISCWDCSGRILEWRYFLDSTTADFDCWIPYTVLFHSRWDVRFVASSCFGPDCFLGIAGGVRYYRRSSGYIQSLDSSGADATSDGITLL